MALSTRAPTVYPVTTIGKKRGDTEKTGQDEAAKMCRLPLWRHDQGSVADKGQRIRQARFQGNRTRTSGLCGPDGIHAARLC